MLPPVRRVSSFSDTHRGRYQATLLTFLSGLNTKGLKIQVVVGVPDQETVITAKDRIKATLRSSGLEA